MIFGNIYFCFPNDLPGAGAAGTGLGAAAGAAGGVAGAAGTGAEAG